MPSSSIFGEFEQNPRAVHHHIPSLDTSIITNTLIFPYIFAGLMMILFGLASGSSFAGQQISLPSQPLAFEPNRGQTGYHAAFLTRGKGYLLYLRPTEVVLALKNPSASTTSHRLEPVHLRLLGASTKARAKGQSPLPGHHNYYIGNDPAQWRTDIPTYGKVIATSVYPGIDVVYYGKEGMLEYDFRVAAGADPKRIHLGFDGADKLKLNRKGDLIITVGKAQLVQHLPYAYQNIGDKRITVSAKYVLHENSISLDLGTYDHHRPLIIDPAFSYISYLGGTGDDVAKAVAVDADGNIYITGSTLSTDFPGSNVTGTSLSSIDKSDAFVTKISKSGSVLFSTYLGSDGVLEPLDGEKGNGIAVAKINGQEKIYITGGTAYSGLSFFPTKGNAYQTSCPNTNSDVFVSILNATDGQLSYSTCVGGGSNEEGLGIAVDSSGKAYVVGYTTSINVKPFPTTSGALQQTNSLTSGLYSSFFFVLDPSISTSTDQLVYSTYLGCTQDNANCSGSTYATAVAVDSNDIAYVAGWTGASETELPAGFPTANAFQGTLKGKQDAFFYKINPMNSGISDLKYASYFGGSDTTQGNVVDMATGIAVDTTGNIYITGATTSLDFPVTANAFQQSFRGGTGSMNYLNNPFGGDAFVAKFSPTSPGSDNYTRSYSTYLGGSGDDEADGIAVDNTTGRAYVAGSTTSTSDFPIVSASHMQAVHAAGTTKDAFVTSLDASGTTLHYSTYLGGQLDDQAHGIAVAAIDKAFVVGSTASFDFPVTSDAEQMANNGSQSGNFLDAFIARIAPVANLNVAIAALVGNDLTNTAPEQGNQLTYTIVLANPQGPDPATGVNLTIDFYAPGTNPSGSLPPLGSTTEADVDNACVDGGYNGTTGHHIFTCQWSTLAVGASKTITITGTLQTGSTLVTDVALTSNENDTKTTTYSLTPGQTLPPPSTIVTGGTTPTPTPSGGGGGGGALGPLALLFLTLATLITYARNVSRYRS